MFYKATTKKKILEDKWETINYIQHNQVCERRQQQNNELKFYFSPLQDFYTGAVPTLPALRYKRDKSRLNYFETIHYPPARNKVFEESAGAKIKLRLYFVFSAFKCSMLGAPSFRI